MMPATPQNRSLSRSNSHKSTQDSDCLFHAGNKRLFSNRESRQLDKDIKTSPYCDKRQRSSSRLLPPCENLKSHTGKDEISVTTCLSPRPRSSRFLEGSMNDRVSQKPPKPYLDVDENSLEECQAQKHKKVFSSLDRTESRNSIVRLRNSIAASLNLSMWKLWSKDHDSKKDEEKANRQLMNARQLKAEKAYSEYKKTGQFANSVPQTHSIKKIGRKISQSSPPVKHDSGVDFLEKRSTSTHVGNLKIRTTSRSSELNQVKRQGRVFIDPPSIPHYDLYNQEERFSLSTPASNSNSPTTAHADPCVKTQSMINLRQKFNCNTCVRTSVLSDNLVRKIPSRKDLQQQQKLVKRISNLEVKLELARHQLAVATGGLVGQKSSQESPFRRTSPLVMRQPPRTEELWTNCENEDHQTEIEDQIRRECRRALSYEASQRNSPASNDTLKIKHKTKSPVWNIKSRPNELPVPTGRSTTSIDGDQVNTMVSYFSESEDEKRKRFKDKDFIQKISHISRKSKDEVDATKNKKTFSIQSPKEASLKSVYRQSTDKKPILSRRISKETICESSKPNVVTGKSSSQTILEGDICIESLNNPALKRDFPMTIESKSSPHQKSAVNLRPKRSRSTSNMKSNNWCSSSPPTSPLESKNRLNKNDGHSCPHSILEESSSVDRDDLISQNYRDYNSTQEISNCCADFNDLNSDELSHHPSITESTILRCWQTTDLAEDDEYFQEIYEQTHPTGYSKPSNSRWTKVGVSGKSPVPVDEANSLVNVFEWPEDVF